MSVGLIVVRVWKMMFMADGGQCVLKEMRAVSE